MSGRILPEDMFDHLPDTGTTLRGYVLGHVAIINKLLDKCGAPAWVDVQEKGEKWIFRINGPAVSGSPQPPPLNDEEARAFSTGLSMGAASMFLGIVASDGPK